MKRGRMDALGDPFWSSTPTGIVAMPQLGISLNPKFNSENSTALARHRTALIQRASEAQRRFPVLELVVGGVVGFGVALAAFWFGTR
jgi:hypothetical protein